MHSIEVRFIFTCIVNGKRVGTPHMVNYSLSLGMTYEEIIQLLIERKFLFPFSDPQLRYNLVIEAFMIRHGRARGAVLYPDGKFGAGYVDDYFSLGVFPDSLREGQNLASMARYFVPPRNTFEGIDYLNCQIYIESKSLPPQEEKPSSVPPSWDKIVNVLLTSLAANAINFAASIVTITTALIVIEKSWSKKHATDSASSQGGFLQPSETDIVAIRLRMTHGDDPKFEEWLTDPERLKHYIDVFNQSSSSIQPLQAIFVQRNGKVLKVDVSKGVQNNLQLDELLSYLNSDSVQK